MSRSRVKQTWETCGKGICRKTIMQKFLLLSQEIVNCNYPDGEKWQENNDRSVRLHQNPQKSIWSVWSYRKNGKRLGLKRSRYQITAIEEQKKVYKINKKFLTTVKRNIWLMWKRYLKLQPSQTRLFLGSLLLKKQLAKKTGTGGGRDWRHSSLQGSRIITVRTDVFSKQMDSLRGVVEVPQEENRGVHFWNVRSASLILSVLFVRGSWLVHTEKASKTFINALILSHFSKACVCGEEVVPSSHKTSAQIFEKFYSKWVGSVPKMIS